MVWKQYNSIESAFKVMLTRLLNCKSIPAFVSLGLISLKTKENYRKLKDVFINNQKCKALETT